MKPKDNIKPLEENLEVSLQNLDLGRQFTDPKRRCKSVTAWLQKKKTKSTMALNEFWLESY